MYESGLAEHSNQSMQSFDKQVLRKISGSDLWRKLVTESSLKVKFKY